MVLSLRTAQGLVFSKPDNMIHLPVKTFPDPRLAIASEVRPHLTDERNRRLRRVVLGFLVYHWFASLSEPSLPLKKDFHFSQIWFTQDAQPPDSRCADKRMTWVTPVGVHGVTSGSCHVRARSLAVFHTNSGWSAMTEEYDGAS